MLLVVVVGDRVLRAGRDHLHRILGAVAVYLLFGDDLGAGVRARRAHVDPGAFALPIPHGPTTSRSSSTTASRRSRRSGTATCVAIHPIARSLAMLEAVIGQLFSAILMARLVGLSLQRVE